MQRRITLSCAVLVLLVAGLLPLIVMFVKSIYVGGDFSLSNYRDLLTSPRQWSLVGNSLTLASFVAVFALGIGVPLGILLSKTDLPLRKMFLVLFTLPMVFPPYILAVSWWDFLNPSGLLAHVAGFETAAIAAGSFRGLRGCVLVLGSALMPVPMLLTVAFLGSINPHLEEAGRLLASWRGVLWRITIPMILPGVALAAVLVFLLTLGEFGVPMYLRHEVFPVEVFTQFSAFYNFEAATASTVPLVLFTLVLLAVERLFLREKTYRLRLAVNPSSGLRISLGNARAPACVTVGIVCFVLVILPLLALIRTSLVGNAYGEALARTADSQVRSIEFALLGASALVVIGFLTGYLIHTRSFRGWLAVDSLTVFLFALPSTVIGVGLISLWNRPSTSFIYATPAILLIGYLAQYAALPSRITVSTLGLIPLSMEEAGRVAGATWFRRMTGIIAPLAARGLIVAWVVSYVFCLRDTGISMMVYPPGQDTLPVRIFTLMANSPPEAVAAACVLMILATLMPLGLFGFILRTARWRA